jgi:hypothetical protein
MCTYPGWPYAAKAVIEHEFDTDHLNIWLTFERRMDVSTIDPDTGLPVPVTPPLENWLIYCDAVEKSAASQEWQDPYTLLIVVSSIVSLPDRVLVKYLEPDLGLRTAEHKQWEPFGPILSLDITT